MYYRYHYYYHYSRGIRAAPDAQPFQGTFHLHGISLYTGFPFTGDFPVQGIPPFRFFRFARLGISGEAPYGPRSRGPASPIYFRKQAK